MKKSCEPSGDEIIDTVRFFYPITPEIAATSDITAFFHVKEGEYSAEASVSVDYYSTVRRAFRDKTVSDSDKKSLYAALSYIVEYCKYYTELDVTKLSNLLITYKQYLVKDESYKAAELDAALGDVFELATVIVKGELQFVFKLRTDFVGSVTFSVGDSERTFEREEGGKTVISFSAFDAADFINDLSIFASGTLGGEEYEATLSYGLADFVAYHAENAVNVESDTRFDSVSCLKLLKSLYYYLAILNS